jgi:subtilisin family serine protease
VVDSGVSLTHIEFTGRIGNGYDFISNDASADDCLGHGTHVAGTLGGIRAGVAKNVTIHPVRVVNCQGSGTGSALIAGIDWVSNNHQKPAVANFSLGGPASSAVDAAINNLLSKGVTVIAAAGNESGVDACLRSPARVANVITVAASDSTDKRSSFSNIGACVDIFAPGTTIWSALPRNTYMSAGCHDSDGDAFGACSGTSMAAPHVAGVAVLYLDANNAATPTVVTNAIIAASTKGKVTDAGANSPNRLLYSEVTESGSASQNYGWMVPARNQILFY